MKEQSSPVIRSSSNLREYLFNLLCKALFFIPWSFASAVMYRRVTLHNPVTSNRMRRVIRHPTSAWLSWASSRQMSTALSHMVPNVEAPDISQAQELVHVRSVSEIFANMEFSR